MKEITISVIHSDIMKIAKDPIIVNVDDDADIINVIAAADQIFAKLNKKPFPIKNLSSLLQLVWDLRAWRFFVDVGIEVRTPEGTWLPLQDDPNLNLPPGTNIKLTPDAGC